MIMFFSVIAAIFALMSYHNSRVVRRKLVGPEYRTTGELLLRQIGRDILPPLIIVLLVTAYADPQSNSTIVGTVQSLVQLFKGTFHPQFQGPYYGTQITKIWFSIRLMVMATVFSCIGGWLLFAVRAVIRQSFVRVIIEWFFTIVESVPDAVYIILSVILVVALIQYDNIIIPAFSDSAPGWMDTWIPAIVLSLPSSFALQRILFLKFGEESGARYIETAIAKGSARRRAIIHHVLPNVVPTFLQSLPAIVAMVISSALFVEFFMEYGGQLSYFLQGVGEGPSDGLPTVIISGGNVVTNSLGLPEFYYYGGSLIIIGVMLVLFWMMMNGGIRLLRQSLYPADLELAVSLTEKRIRWGAVSAGGILICLVVVLGLFPQLLTNFKPNYEDLTSSSTLPPILPNHLHPFGTDAMGRDFLSRTLSATLPSLLNTAVITAAIVVLSLVLCTIIFYNPNSRISNFATRVSRTLSSIPTLFIVFLVLYPENRIVEEMYTHVQPNFWWQAFSFVFWIAVIETGRFSFELKQHIQDWYSFSFVESAVSIGRGRISILFTHLRSWLGRYLLEFGLTEFVRVMSIMTQLAALHIYFQEMIGYLPFKELNAQNWALGLISATPTWFGMVGESTVDMAFISYPFYLEGPLLALLISMVGANLIAYGIRGTDKELKKPSRLTVMLKFRINHDTRGSSYEA